MPVLGHVGSDYPRLRPDFKVIQDPYSGRQVLLVPPIVPDVALIHALRADPEGNLLLEETEDDALLAQASRRVIASAEEIVPPEALRASPRGTFLSGIHVSAVVHLPGGAHPTTCRGAYALDDMAIREYVAAAQAEAAFEAYLRRSVLELPDHEAYLERVGLRAPAPA